MRIASRRTSGLVFVTALAGAVLVVPAGGAAQAAVGCAHLLDVNGDGYADTIVGVPGEDVRAAADAGAVTVLLGGSSRKPYGAGGYQLTAATLGGTVGPGDRFGSAIAVADYNADGCLDIAIGAPGRSDGAGTVVIAYLTSAGASAAGTTWVTQSGPEADDAPEPGDGFGSSLAFMSATDPDNARAYLWVGAPGEDIGPIVDAGSVTRLGDEELTDPITDHVVTMHQGDSARPGSPEAGDQFGEALTGGVGWVAVGAPGEDVGALADAGSVTMIGRFAPASTVTQNSSGVPDSAEAGDRFGAALATTWDCDSENRTVVIGAPGEDLGTAKDAGIVTVLGDSRWTTGSYAVSQNSAGIPGVAESGDHFGASVVGDWSGWAAGAPGEDIGAAANAGLVTDVWQWCEIGESNEVSGGLSFAQSTAGVPGTDESGDAFGSSLAINYWVDAKDDTQSAVIVGAPGEDVGTGSNAGAVTVIPYVASTFLLTAKGSATFNESSLGVLGAAESGDGFGASLDSVS